jgi:hypothetical protein
MNFASIAYVHGIDSGAKASNILVAAVEPVFSVVDNAVNYFARRGAGFFLIVALLLVCNIVQFELRRKPGERHGQRRVVGCGTQVGEVLALSQGA